MRKRLYALAGLALALLLVFVVSSIVLKVTKKPVCQRFVIGIQHGDATGTYKMFTTRGQGLITAKDWTTQVGLLKAVYGTDKPAVIGKPSPNVDSATKKITSYQTSYAVASNGFAYKATCISTVAESDKVDSFTSQLRF